MFTSMGFPITEESTSADLTKAFRTLALKYHPDKGGDPAVFQSISNARDVLMGAGRKRKHTRKAKKTKKSKKSKKTSKRR
jgi:curved DNA-binding protein CbpA